MPDFLIDDTFLSLLISADNRSIIGAALSISIGLWLSFKLGFWLTVQGIGSNISRSLKLSQVKYVETTPSGFQLEHALAGFLVDHLILPFRDQRELGSQLQIEHCSDEIMRMLPFVVEDFIDDVMDSKLPSYWPTVPETVKKRIYTHTLKHSRLMLDDLFEDMLAEMAQLWDIKAHMTSCFHAEQKLPTRFIEQVLQQDLKVAKRKILPLALLGTALFYLVTVSTPDASLRFAALTLICPILAAIHIRLLRKRWATLLTAEQQPSASTTPKSTSLVYRFIGDNFFKPHTIFTAMFSGRKRKRAMQLVRKHSNAITDESPLKTVIQLNEGFEAYVRVKQEIIDTLPKLILDSLQDHQFNQDRGNALERYLVGSVFTHSVDRQLEPLNYAIAQLQHHYLAVAALMGLIVAFTSLSL